MSLPCSEERGQEASLAGSAEDLPTKLRWMRKPELQFDMVVECSIAPPASSAELPLNFLHHKVVLGNVSASPFL